MNRCNDCFQGWGPTIFPLSKVRQVLCCGVVQRFWLETLDQTFSASAEKQVPTYLPSLSRSSIVPNLTLFRMRARTHTPVLCYIGFRGQVLCGYCVGVGPYCCVGYFPASLPSLGSWDMAAAFDSRLSRAEGTGGEPLKRRPWQTVASAQPGPLVSTFRFWLARKIWWETDGERTKNPSPTPWLRLRIQKKKKSHHS